MKKILLTILAALGLLAVPPARAWTYTDGDVLLIFRDGAHDVEYDLGNINQFLGHPNGYTTNVAWGLSLATSTFGSSDLTGIGVVVVATTTNGGPNSVAWISGAEPNATAYNPGSGGWSYDYYSTIDALGVRPVQYSVPTNTVPSSYSILAGGKYKYASYDYIVAGGNGNGIDRLGGHAPFIVEQTIPGSFDFWAVQPTAVTSSLVPDSLVGTFTIGSDGTLTFVAGPRHSNITGITSSANVDTITFSTTVGNSYSLAFTNKLGGFAAWPVIGGPIIGDGNNDSITHTNSGSTGFYRIKTQ